MCDYDETQAIGRRYRRQDEVGTPVCITVDFDTLDDRAVTVRDRDSMEQERVAIDALLPLLLARLTCFVPVPGPGSPRPAERRGGTGWVSAGSTRRAAFQSKQKTINKR